MLYHTEDVKQYFDPVEDHLDGMEASTRLGLAELIFEFKAGSGKLDPFIDPPVRSKSGTPFDGTKHPLFKTFDNTPIGRQRRENLGQITAYASAVMKQQYRTHCYVVFVVGTEFRIVRYDRSGAIVTRAVDYKKKPRMLLDFLWRYCNAGRAIWTKNLEPKDKCELQ